MEPYNMLDLIISTHALHAESDLHRRCDTPCHSVISTHALHAESDRCASTGCARRTSYFYPRSPCGERPAEKCLQLRLLEFLPTLSMRRATTSEDVPIKRGDYFYPRSPCGERHTAFCYLRQTLNFYPRSPCGERPHKTWIKLRKKYFYPRSPCGERLVTWGQYQSIRAFLPTLSMRRATRNF